MNEHKHTIVEVLNLFPEVRWDRFTEFEKEFDIFGWIDRNDSYKDFMLMHFRDGAYEGYTTSSARYTHEFSDRLDVYLKKDSMANVHVDCQRVEDLNWPVQFIQLRGK